jgi:hypothetical protein
VRAALGAFADDTYLHQVVERAPDGTLTRHRDLPEVLGLDHESRGTDRREWRIHFHIPLHAPATPLFGNTQDHLLGVLDLVAADPGLCRHFEMETYTWEVMPAAMKNRSVVDQLVAEYDWTLAQLRQRGLAD